MNKEVMQKWVKALRSGEFAQAKAQLENCGTYCCLGVLCKLAEQEGVNVIKNENGYLHGETLREQPDVLKWSGIRDNIGYLGVGNESLTYLNDEKSYNFTAIADVIESKWESL